AEGTQVELLLPRGVEPTLEVQAVLPPGLALASGGFIGDLQRPETKQPLLVQKGTTGADGTLELSGHGDRALALRLTGSRHLPVVVPDVRLDVAEPLVVTVHRGATIAGELRPADVLAPLQPQPEELAMLRMMGAKGQEMLAA